MLTNALGDALHVTGHVAAFHRQRSAIARDRADRVFRDFLDPLSGHRPPPSHKCGGRTDYENRPTSSLTTSRKSAAADAAVRHRRGTGRKANAVASAAIA